MRSRGTVAALVVGLLLAGVAAWLLVGRQGRIPPPATVPVSIPPAPPAPRPDPATPSPTPPAPAETSGGGGSESPAPAPAGILVVRVEGSPAGTPIPGATVEVRGRDDAVLRSAAADGGGTVRFEGIAQSEVTLRTVAKDRAPEWTTVSDLDKPGAREITVSLDPGVALSGIVLSKGARHPVPGARVEAQRGGSLEHRSTSYAEPRLMETTADDEGRFSVEGIPLEIMVTLSAEAPGFVRGDRALLLGEGAADHPRVEILLEEGASASGRVTDPDGQPVAGAEVRATADEEGADETGRTLEDRLGPWGFGLRTAAAATTEEDGCYTVSGLRLGVAYRFHARAKGFARSPLSAPPRTADAPGQELVQDLRLRRAASIRALAVDPDGSPLPGAEVAIQMTRHSTLGPKDEGGGSFRFEVLTPGEYRIVASSKGLLPAEETVALTEGETREVRLVPARGAVLAGTVVDDRGTPVAGAGVWASPSRGGEDDAPGGGPEAEGRAATDAEGRFRIEGLRPGLHGVSAGAGGHGGVSADHVEVPASDVRLVMPRSGRVRFRLLPPQGVVPPSRVDVSVMEMQGGGHGQNQEWNDGRIVIEDVAPRPMRIAVDVAGFVQVVREVTLTAGEVRDLGGIALDPGVEFSGRVVDGAGEPVAGARIEAYLAGFMRNAVATAGGDGRFRLRHLPGVETRVRVGAEGFLDAEESVPLGPGVNARTFVLRPPARIRGTVRDAEGKPATRTKVVVVHRGEAAPGVPGERTVRTDGDGTFLALVAAGSWSVEARDAEDRVLTGKIVAVEAEGEAVVELALPSR